LPFKCNLQRYTAVFDCIIAHSASASAPAADRPIAAAADSLAVVNRSTHIAAAGEETRATTGNVKRGGVCPRVVVRFASILRLAGSHVLDDGAACALAESLVGLALFTTIFCSKSTS
jgi:ribosomal protein L14